jgi:hypothetical protein
VPILASVPRYRRRVVWVRAQIEVAHADVERETAFWSAVVGGPLPAYLSVQMQDPPWGWRGPPGITVVVERDSPAPVTPPPSSFPGVRRSRVYQVCLDRPGRWFDEDAAWWAEATGGHIEVLERRPEFAWVRIPGGPLPLGLLLQRLGETDGPGSAHLDVGTSDREAEVRRHLALGATQVADEEFWTVLADPVGFPYCVTDRDPATGELV